MIQVINRAFDIIEFLAKDSNRSFTLSEIADGLKLNRGTTANIIKTMIVRNYIEQISPKKGYKLGYMMYQVLGGTSFEDRLKRASTEVMESMTAKTRETSLLAILKKQNRLIVHQVHSDRDLMVKTSIEKEAYNSASGRLLIAMLDEKELNDFIERYGLPKKEVWAEATTLPKLRAQLNLIREQGFARHLPPSHILGLACAVEEKGTVVASISLYLPVSRLTAQNEKIFLKELIAAADTINLKLQQ